MESSQEFEKPAFTGRPQFNKKIEEKTPSKRRGYSSSDEDEDDVYKKRRALGKSKPEYVQAPANLVGIRIGKKLRIKERFLSDETCPYGAGKPCMVVEGGYIVIDSQTSKGSVWIKAPSMQGVAP